MDFDTLARWYDRQCGDCELTQLPTDFWDSAQKLMESYDQLIRDSNNYAEVDLWKDQRHSAGDMITGLYERRLAVICEKGVLAGCGIPVPLTNLTPVEQLFYDSLVSMHKKNRHEVLRKLA